MLTIFARELVSIAILTAFATGVRVGDTEDVDSASNSSAEIEDGAGDRPFNCHRNLEFWESFWPAAKKEWCCFHENMGCKSEHFDCADGLQYYETEWSEMKKEWCCHNNNVGCAKCDDFLCPEGHDKMKMAVVGSIKCVKWPCKNSECCELWGNMDLERLPTTAPTPFPTFDPTPTPTIAPTPDEDRFHCQSAMVDSILGWSQAKKEWCCFNRNMGCKDVHSEHIVSNEPHSDTPHGGSMLDEHSSDDHKEKHGKASPDLELKLKPKTAESGNRDQQLATTEAE